MGTIIGWGADIGTIIGWLPEYIWGLYEKCCNARIHKGITLGSHSPTFP